MYVCKRVRDGELVLSVRIRGCGKHRSPVHGEKQRRAMSEQVPECDKPEHDELRAWVKRLLVHGMLV